MVYGIWCMESFFFLMIIYFFPLHIRWQINVFIKVSSFYHLVSVLLMASDKYGFIYSISRIFPMHKQVPLDLSMSATGINLVTSTNQTTQRKRKSFPPVLEQQNNSIFV